MYIYNYINICLESLSSTTSTGIFDCFPASTEFLRTLNSALSASEGPYAAPTPRTPAHSARGEVHVLLVLHFTRTTAIFSALMRAKKRTNRATGTAVRSKLVRGSPARGPYGG